MAMVLQQALRGLCYKAGWSYAVFWKLKRRSRMVLTWEDGFYEFSKTPVPSFDPAQPNGSYHMMGNGGRSVTDGPTADIPGSEDQLGLAVARMSYHVYSLGEGIIGRVAFTGKHQWVFADRGSAGEGNPSGRSGRAISEKYPAGWQQQFAAGIKTIAVVAVPQGVVQLGSTQTVMEDLTLVGHVRALFGTLQSVPGAFLSDYVPESQDGRVATPSMVMPMPMMMLMGANNNNIAQMQMNMSNMPQVATSGIGTGSYDMRNMSKPMMPVRPRLNPFLPSPASPLSSIPIQQTSRITPGPLLNKESPARNVSLLSTVSMAMGNRQSRLNPFPSTGSEASPVAPSSKSSPTVPPPLLARNLKSSSPVPLAVSKTKIGSLLDRNVQADATRGRQLQSSVLACGVSVSQDSLGSVRGPLRSSSKSLTGRLVPETGSTRCEPLKTHVREAYLPAESCRAESVCEPPSSATEVSDAVASADGSREHNHLYSTSSKVVSLVQTRIPSPSGERIDLGLKSPSLKVLTVGPAENWSEALTHERSEPDSLDISNQFHDDARNTVSCQQQGEVDTAAKETFKLRSQTFGGLAGITNGLVPTSETTGSGILGRNDSTEGGGTSASMLSETSSGVWGESQKADWDCFSSLLSPFAIGDELSQALRPLSTRNSDGDLFSSLLQQRVSLGTEDNSAVDDIGNTLLSSDNGPSRDAGIPLGYDIFKVVADAVLVDSRSEPLLEAVVTGVAGVSSFPFAPYASSVPSPSKVDSSSQERNSSACSNALPGEAECILQRTESCWAASSGDPFEQDATTNGVSPCTGETELENVMKISQAVRLNGGRGHRRSDDEIRASLNTQGKRQLDAGKTGNSRKKGRHGDSQRPRPKDRQQIQDRVKELREIVPNASKCSIDALLEKTIKHMSFLQSATQHGEKWRQFGNLKENVEFLLEHPDSSDLQAADDRLETDSVVSSQLDKLDSGCPVVVQNLNHPRQMLVEMLCEDRRLFLEIADTVRGLGLTILKGTMENRSGKTWVRFVVEAASHDIHRVEVLWNLTQLLEPTAAAQQTSPFNAGYDRPSDYMDPSCVHSDIFGNTPSSLSPAFPHLLSPSIPLQMSAR
ncbi:hypothetical protein R1sor_023346 [Riccia sorocarpa]|uniref:BHLH domain-containing protein n=1 Tax=Riccia sorocarpa TaxID=122646 RepID=A0ABD3GQL7_9MARC